MGSGVEFGVWDMGVKWSLEFGVWGRGERVDGDVTHMQGKELDNIIATSLKQLESARDFYEKMQAQVKDKS